MIRDGKITAFTIDNTAEWKAKLEQALAAPQTLPQTGGESSPSYALLIAFGGLALLLVGLGVLHRQARAV